MRVAPAAGQEVTEEFFDGLRHQHGVGQTLGRLEMPDSAYPPNDCFSDFLNFERNRFAAVSKLRRRNTLLHQAAAIRSSQQLSIRTPRGVDIDNAVRHALTINGQHWSGL